VETGKEVSNMDQIIERIFEEMRNDDQDESRELCRNIKKGGVYDAI
jgi:hypothetical protein